MKSQAASARQAPQRAFAVALTLALPLGCSSGARSYGKLACFDAFPAAPAATSPKAPLDVKPAILWQMELPANGSIGPSEGVALSGDHIVTTTDTQLTALDRFTGKIVFSTTVSGNRLMVLGRASVTEDGGIRVQAPEGVVSSGGVASLAADGTIVSWAGPGGHWSAQGDPAEGFGEDVILAGPETLAASVSDEVALDATGATLWSSAYGASTAMGHWGFGDDGAASYVVDLRTGEHAGRLRADDGQDVEVMTPLAGRGILTIERHVESLTLILFDTCGKQAWSTRLLAGCGHIGGAVVGPGEISYFMTMPCDDPASDAIVGVSPDGRIVSTTPRQDGPWLVGADGTIYAATFSEPDAHSHLAALSPSLEELWRLDLGGDLRGSNAVLTDDGILYARVLTRTAETVVAIQTKSPGLASSSWPTLRHDNRASGWGGGPF